METGIIAVITGLVGFLVNLIATNPAVREFFTEHMLKVSGKFSSKKIPLKTHKAFIIVKNYNNHLNLFLFNGHTKSIFYKEFIGVIFKNITTMMDNVISTYEKAPVMESPEFVLMEAFENCRTSINKEIEETLNIPSKIQNQISHWQNLMLNSLKNSLEQLITDDSNNETYFKIYRVLDAILTTANFITGTGSILFNNINGAFDEIAVEQIYKTSKDA